MHHAHHPEVRSRDLYPSGFVNTSSTNVVDSGHGSLASQNSIPNVSAVSTMPAIDIKFPIFNGNGLEDLEKHWFLRESVWAMLQVQDNKIKKEQLITTLRGRVLDWYMKFSIVPVGVA